MTIQEPIPCGLHAPVHPDGRPAACSPQWVTETVVWLARGIHAEETYDRMPILADALEEAGCDDALLLHHCRWCERHVVGCWAVVAVLEGFENGQPVVVPILPKPTTAGRLLDALREELRLFKPPENPFRPRRIPEREQFIARLGCFAAVLLTAASIIATLWWCGAFSRM